MAPSNNRRIRLRLSRKEATRLALHAGHTATPTVLLSGVQFTQVADGSLVTTVSVARQSRWDVLHAYNKATGERIELTVPLYGAAPQSCIPPRLWERLRRRAWCD